MVLQKFTIPAYGEYVYPLPNTIPENHLTDSWYTMHDNLHGCITEDVLQTVTRCKKVDIHLTTLQKAITDDWFNIYKYVYNLCVKYIRIHTPKQCSLISLRPLVKNTISTGMNALIKKSHIPKHTIDNAINDVCKAYKSAIALAKVTKRRFRIRYKRSTSKDTIVLEASAFSKKKNSFVSKTLGIVISSSSIAGINRDCRLQRHGNSLTYTLFVPTEVPIKQVIWRKEQCSLDPGLRTFQTVYSVDNWHSEYSEFGTNLTQKISPLLDKVEHVTNTRYKRRIRDKISHLVDDMHWKVAKYLATTYDTILIGNMSTKGVVQGKLHPGTKRLMYAASHYTFRQRLKNKCEEYGARFIEVDESYTSKTCGNCGEINQKLGANKVFNCQCGFTLLRDVNGARNIMIKCLQ